MLELILFVLLGLIAVIAAVGVVLFRNVVYSALSLLVNFLTLAALYILLNAQFLAAAQVIIYAGAILVLFLFVIMYIGADRDRPILSRGRRAKIGLVLAVALLAEVAYALGTRPLQGLVGEMTPTRVAEVGNVQLLGQALFTRFLLPFELAGVLLLVAIIGAIYLGKREA